MADPNRSRNKQCRLLITEHWRHKNCFFYLLLQWFFSTCWHITAIHAGPHVGPPFCGGPCSAEYDEHA